MRIFGILAAIATLAGGAAQATVINVVNSNFEDSANLNITHSLGNYNNGSIPGWSLNWTNDAGIWAPSAAGMSTSFTNGGAFNTGNQVAYLNANTGLFQLTNTLIQGQVDYSLSALFGHRTQLGFGGVFGLYAQSQSGVITQLTNAIIQDPGLGLLAAQTNHLGAATVSNFIGQRLGIYFIGSGRQTIIDNINLQSNAVVPLPAAIWMFGTALAGGGAFMRRRKAKKAA